MMVMLNYGHWKRKVDNYVKLSKIMDNYKDIIDHEKKVNLDKTFAI
jgi:hypothetical protein